jgi:uncharacterized protein YdhG (YjbR/CyaY superfamily)
VKFTIQTAMLEKITQEQAKLRNRSNYDRQKADARELCKVISFITPRYKRRANNSVKLKPLMIPKTTKNFNEDTIRLNS